MCLRYVVQCVSYKNVQKENKYIHTVVQAPSLNPSIYKSTCKKQYLSLFYNDLAYSHKISTGMYLSEKAACKLPPAQQDKSIKQHMDILESPSEIFDRNKLHVVGNVLL